MNPVGPIHPTYDPCQRGSAAAVECLTPRLSERLRRLRSIQFYQRQSVESVMRLESSPSIAVIESPKDVTDEYRIMEQLALLQMLYLPVAQKVSAIIQGEEGIQDRPSWSQYKSLTDKGLCIRPVGNQYHVLTNDGRSVARHLLVRLCQKFNVHDMLEQRNDEAVYYRCSCGRWSRVVSGSGGSKQWLRMHQSFSAHVPKGAREIA